MSTNQEAKLYVELTKEQQAKVRESSRMINVLTSEQEAIEKAIITKYTSQLKSMGFGWLSIVATPLAGKRVFRIDPILEYDMDNDPKAKEYVAECRACFRKGNMQGIGDFLKVHIGDLLGSMRDEVNGGLLELTSDEAVERELIKQGYKFYTDTLAIVLEG